MFFLMLKIASQTAQTVVGCGMVVPLVHIIIVDIGPHIVGRMSSGQLMRVPIGMHPNRYRICAYSAS